jgi:hypothetical protein
VQQPTVGVRTHAGHGSARSCLALVAWVLLAGLAASRAEAAAPPGQWWNAAYAERLNVVVTGRGTAAATQYSLAVTIDHARMVARAGASGNDVRVVYRTGRLGRAGSPTTSPLGTTRDHALFRTGRARALATDDNYHLLRQRRRRRRPRTGRTSSYDDSNDGVFDRPLEHAGASSSRGTLNRGPGTSAPGDAFGTELLRLQPAESPCPRLPPTITAATGVPRPRRLWANTSNHNFETRSR